MVTTYGMSKILGPLAYDKGQQNTFLGEGMGNPRRMVSDDTAKEIDLEVREIVEQGHTNALTILNQNRELLEAIAEKILEKEVIEGEELQGLLAQVTVPDLSKD
jgi:cell division protease FtsH